MRSAAVEQHKHVLVSIQNTTVGWGQSQTYLTVIQQHLTTFNSKKVHIDSAVIGFILGLTDTPHVERQLVGKSR